LLIVPAGVCLANLPDDSKPDNLGMSTLNSGQEENSNRNPAEENHPLFEDETKIESVRR